MFEVGCNAKMQVMASQRSKRGVHDKLDMANFCSHGRDDYNSLTSDIFQAILLTVRPLKHCLSNAMYGCPIKLGINVAINGFCPIISENL